MRIWSLHPKYLDTKGLVAVWRETLLAKHVLEGVTKGYRNHPQLDRFKASPQPLDAIHFYLAEVYVEATGRGYKFDRKKFNGNRTSPLISVTTGQMQYETQHLLHKLKFRDMERHQEIIALPILEHHPLFTVIEGGIEPWEVVVAVGN